MVSFPKEAVRINFALYSGDFSSPAGWSHLSCAILSRISSSVRPSYSFFPPSAAAVAAANAFASTSSSAKSFLSSFFLMNLS